VKFFRIITATAIVLAVAVLFLQRIISANEEQKQREIAKIEKEKEKSAVEMAFATKYGAEFIHYKDSYRTSVFTCDLQAKVDSSSTIAFFAFVDDVERNGDRYVVHMTCFLSERAREERKILFHLDVAEDIVHKILSAKPVREPTSVIRSPRKAPLMVVARIDKLLKPTEGVGTDGLERSRIERENKPNRFDSYGEILGCEIRKLAEDY